MTKRAWIEAALTIGIFGALLIFGAQTYLNTYETSLKRLWQSENVADRDVLRDRIKELETAIDLSIQGRAAWRLVDINNRLVECEADK